MDECRVVRRRRHFTRARDGLEPRGAQPGEHPRRRVRRSQPRRRGVVRLPVRASPRGARVSPSDSDFRGASERSERVADRGAREPRPEGRRRRRRRRRRRLAHDARRRRRAPGRGDRLRDFAVPGRRRRRASHRRREIASWRVGRFRFLKAGGRARRGSAAPAARLLACLSSRRDARALARARARRYPALRPCRTIDARARSPRSAKRSSRRRRRRRRRLASTTVRARTTTTRVVRYRRSRCLARVRGLPANARATTRARGSRSFSSRACP